MKFHVDGIPTCPVDLANAATFADGPPHQLFAELREHVPVAWNPPGVDADGFWCLTRFDDIVPVNKDWQRFSSARKGSFLTEGGILPKEFTSLIFNMMDPPVHDRHRGLVQTAFTPKAINEREQDIRRTINLLIDDVIERGECDVVRDLAIELPLIVTANMLGAPVEDRKKLFAWANVLSDTTAPREEKLAVMGQVSSYLPQLIASRRQQPTEDLLSRLLHAELNGERLSEVEVMAHFVQLMLGGSETTRNAYAGGLLALLEYPEQMQRLRDEPALIPNAVEEILRWVTPIHHQARTATCDLQIGDMSIAENDKVVMWYAAANRDPAQNPDPGRFDVARVKPKHLTFGMGLHVCVGNQLARLELRVALEETLRRLTKIELSGPATRKPSNCFNWMLSVPIRFEPGPREGVTERI